MGLVGRMRVPHWRIVDEKLAVAYGKNAAVGMADEQHPCLPDPAVESVRSEPAPQTSEVNESLGLLVDSPENERLDSGALRFSELCISELVLTGKVATQ